MVSEYHIEAEQFWSNKADCDYAEKTYYEELYGNPKLPKRLSNLEIENKSLKNVTDEMKKLVIKLESRVSQLEKTRNGIEPASDVPSVYEDVLSPSNNRSVKKTMFPMLLAYEEAKSPRSPLGQATLNTNFVAGKVPLIEKRENGVGALKSKPAEVDDDDEDVDFFSIESEDEEANAEKERITAERLKAYHEKKSKKPALVAKTSVLLDIKPWDDETDMNEMLKCAKSITKEGLVWGASKLVPVGYGINKLQLMCVVEDDKVSIDELSEQIAEFEDYVQSVDIAAMSKI
jgi:translation elongation factor EF-1beta